ncbi:hypothetical protein ABIE67_008848 [Streptomyces sp. V4I8]|uniref:hypothetical protein n=1 Tax=Streptomyces sp. V4I8 TaxID=3156469 RepID=UPI0035134E7A
MPTRPRPALSETGLRRVPPTARPRAFQPPTLLRADLSVSPALLRANPSVCRLVGS